MPLSHLSSNCVIVINYRAIFDTSAEQSETHVLMGCIKNCSIVKLYNKVLLITNVYLFFCTISKDVRQIPCLHKKFTFYTELKIDFCIFSTHFTRQKIQKNNFFTLQTIPLHLKFFQKNVEANTNNVTSQNCTFLGNIIALCCIWDYRKVGNCATRS